MPVVDHGETTLAHKPVDTGTRYERGVTCLTAAVVERRVVRQPGQTGILLSCDDLTGMASIQLYRTTNPPFGVPSQVDVSDLGIGGMVERNSYDSPAELSFSVLAASHELPFETDQFIVVWDADDDSQSISNPLFEGYIEEVTPSSETNRVHIKAYDPTYRATRKVTVMSNAWEVVGGALSPGAASYPRFVANCNIDSDDDWAYMAVQGGTVGEIIKKVLDDQKNALYFVNAAPGDGSPSGSQPCYVTSEITGNGVTGDGQVGGMEMVPQEKIVGTSESVSSLIQRMVDQYEPSWRYTWVPGERRFRFSDIEEMDESTITVNSGQAEFDGEGNQTTFPVLAIQMRRSLEGRYTAVSFYGPEAVEWREAVCTYPPDGGDTLQDISTIGTIGTSPHTGTCRHRWQITDPEFTRVARRGNTPVQVPGPIPLSGTNEAGDVIYVGHQLYVDAYFPTLQVQFPDGEGGDDNWYTVGGWTVDARTGIVSILNGCLYRDNPEAVSSRITEPDYVKFVYPNMVGPLTVRYPSSGYTGTAYTVAGIENELRIYDEQMATGYNFLNIPITDSERQGKFEKLAKSILDERKDIIYAGGVTLDGLDYSWRNLRKKVHFAAKDDDGNAITTGWEDVGAILTDVEYDFEEETTTLQFNSNLFELVGIDTEQLKHELGFRERQFTFIVTSQLIFNSQFSGRGVIANIASSDFQNLASQFG